MRMDCPDMPLTGNPQHVILIKMIEDGQKLAMAKAVAPRVRSVADDLRRRISQGQLRHGQRLPSIRTLAGQLDVSFGTAQAAIKYLERLGLVEGHQGSGVYVRRGGGETPASQAALVYVLVSTRSRLFLWLMQPLLTALQRKGFVPVPVICDEDDPAQVSHLPTLWAQHPPRAVIAKGLCSGLAGAAAQHCPRDTRLISIYGAPVPPFRGWHMVVPDELTTYRLAAERLLARGHQRIGVLTGRRVQPGQFPRHLLRFIETHVVGAATALQQAGISSGLSVYRILPEDDQRNLGMDPSSIGRIAHWLSGLNRPTALLMTNSRLPCAELALDAAGLTVGRDVDIICIGDGEPARQGLCDCYDERRNVIIDYAMELVESDTPGFDAAVRHILVPPEFVAKQAVTGARAGTDRHA